MANGYQTRKTQSTNPIDAVIGMQNEGKDDAEIVASLTSQGLKPAQISDALNQAKIKQAVTAKSEVPPVPGEFQEAAFPMTSDSEALSPSIMSQRGAQQQAVQEEIPMPGAEPLMEGQMPAEEYGYAPQAGIDTEAIEEIAESIIGEKWEEAKAKISRMTEWKDYTDNRLASAESKMKRIESSLDNLQAALLGKVQKYEQNIKDLGTEMKSLQGAFSKVLSPLASNVQELQRLTGRLRTAKHPAEHAEKRHEHKKRKK